MEMDFNDQASSSKGRLNQSRSMGKKKSLSKYKLEESFGKEPKKKYSGVRHDSTTFGRASGGGDENESEYTYYSETETSIHEEQYLQFLKQYGHMDFSLLRFLPEVNVSDEIREIKKQGSRYSRGARPRAGELSVINEEQNEEQTIQSGVNNLQRTAEFELETVKVNRFDFNFNNMYEVQNITFDPTCVRFQSNSNMQARVIADDGICF